jgi:enoyl-CoA hydratase/carnithine racemase
VRWQTEAHAPMGPSRMNLSKPVIAAVAGGLELASLHDLRVVSAFLIWARIKLFPRFP